MTNPTTTAWLSQRLLTAVYAVAIAILIVNVAFTVRNIKSMTRLSKLMARTHEVVKKLDDVRADLLTAEIHKNAFLLTGKDADLKALRQTLAKVGVSIGSFDRVLAADVSRRSHFETVQRAVVEEMAEMDKSARARPATGPAGGLAAVVASRGAGLRDEVERRIEAMEAADVETRRNLSIELNAAFIWTILAFLIASALALVLLLGVHYLSYRSRRAITLNAEWLATTLRSIGDAVIATDASGRVGFMNRIAEELTGWSEAEAVGLPLDRVFVIINESTREPAPNPVEQVLATGMIQGIADHMILIAKEGQERLVDDSAAPIRVHEGVVRGVVMVFRDVTRERAAGLERDRLNQELSEKDKRKDEFLAMLAHELRNPLAAIGNAVMLSSRSDMRDHLDWSLDVIRRQMRHLSRLIDDLLDVARISRGKIELKCGRIDAVSILHDAVESVRPLIEEKQHALKVCVEPEGLWADADPIRLEQIIVNLLNNAAKFTDKGGTIEVSARREDDSVTIVISDTGVGIPPEKLPEMFDLFVQGDRSSARSEGGLGIGLTVVKKLVEMHGGRISARSGGPGKGSEFTIRIPAAEPIAVAVHNPAKTVSNATGSRVLVVDDNVDTVLSLSRILTILGHQVAAAYNGPEAIESARKTRPEFILLDIGLPGMDGYEVARRLRREDCCRDSVVIAITGYSHEAARHRSKESGFDHYLVKPLDRDALVTILTRS